MSNIAELRDIIRRLHGAKATHRESMAVTETFNGKTMWDGTVQVFDLHGHPNTSTVYAWSNETDDPDNPNHVTVLHIGPIASAAHAVRAAIIQEFRRLEPATENQ